mmetsp:Transcript_72262/g.150767  ORF Transcript_72262/g.150767 Transcript_72262/m.150767 type:complete len:97 (+) Transcript_72262:86-376(+)
MVGGNRQLLARKREVATAVVQGNSTSWEASWCLLGAGAGGETSRNDDGSESKPHRLRGTSVVVLEQSPSGQCKGLEPDPVRSASDKGSGLDYCGKR